MSDNLTFFKVKWARKSRKDDFHAVGKYLKGKKCFIYSVLSKVGSIIDVDTLPLFCRIIKSKILIFEPTVVCCKKGKKQPLEMLYEKAVLKDFAIFTQKQQICRSLF